MGTGWGTAGASCFSSTFLGRAIVAVVVFGGLAVWRLMWLLAAAGGLQSGGLVVNGECWRGGVVGQVQGANWCGGGVLCV